MNATLEIHLADGLVVISTGRPPGPAGVSALWLSDGAVELLVDTAEPHRLVSVTTDLGDLDRSEPSLHSLFGPMVTDSIAAWAATASDGAPPASVGTHDPTLTVIGPMSRLGRLAVGLDEVSSEDPNPLVEALAMVDLGCDIINLVGDLRVDPAGQALVETGLDRLEHLRDEDREPPGGRLWQQILRRRPGWIETISDRRPDLSDRFSSLWDRILAPYGETDRRQTTVDDLTMVDHARLLMMPAAAPMAAAEMAAAEIADAAEASAAAPRTPQLEVLFPPGVSGRKVSATLERHHLVTHLGGLPDGSWWLRAFRVDATGGPPRLLAVAPLVGDTWGHSGIALVGPDVNSADLLVDVSRHPAEPWTSTATRASTEAVILGRRAARTSRAGARSTESWEECARAWTDAGDPQRALQAQSFADRPPFPIWADTDPLLTDLA